MVFLLIFSLCFLRFDLCRCKPLGRKVKRILPTKKIVFYFFYLSPKHDNKIAHSLPESWWQFVGAEDCQIILKLISAATPIISCHYHHLLLPFFQFPSITDWDFFFSLLLFQSSSNPPTLPVALLHAPQDCVAMTAKVKERSVESDGEQHISILTPVQTTFCFCI